MILRLAGRSVVVLMDLARAERLGELVRHLLREMPDVDVLTEAPALASLPEGSTVVLCVRAVDAAWLNQERPVVQERALRLVLFSDEETTVHLARCAVDFYDWISHRIDCPAGPPAFAVRALRRAACAREPAIGWYGGNIEETVARALPGCRIERVSAMQPYPALVEALRPKPRTWVAVADLNTSDRMCRLRWAAAEAGRRGRLLLVEPANGPSWLPRVQAQALALDAAARRLCEAGIQRSVLLSSLLELAPDAFDDAAKLANAGVPEAELFALALREEDPGVALARLVQERGGKRAAAKEADGEEPGSELNKDFQLPDWSGRIARAFHYGDLEVAEHWAAGWIAATDGSARATIAQARVRFLSGDFGDARVLIERARARNEDGADEQTRFELLWADGLVRIYEGDTAQAIKLVRNALDLGRRLRRWGDERDELYDAAVRALIQVGSVHDVKKMLDEWTELVRREQVDPLSNILLARSTATMMLELGDAQGASQLMESVLKKWPDHPSRGIFEQLLAQALIKQGRVHEAELLLRRAIERLRRLGLPSISLRHEHGRALLMLGRFQEAERELRRVLEEAPAERNTIPTRHELARCLTAQGRFDEAEALLDQILLERRQRNTDGGALYAASIYEKARIHRLRGDLVRAEALLREVLGLEEKILGREHPTLLVTLSELGWTLIDLGKVREAEPIVRRAALIAERVGDRTVLATALGLRARAQAAQGFAHARDTARRALQELSATDHELAPAIMGELEAIAAGVAPRSSSRSRRNR